MNVGDPGWGGPQGVRWEQLLLPAQRSLADLPPAPASCSQGISESLVKPPPPDCSVPGVTVQPVPPEESLRGRAGGGDRFHLTPQLRLHYQKTPSEPQSRMSRGCIWGKVGKG